MATMRADKKGEVKELRKALIPFARIWAMNLALSPKPEAGVRDYVAGVWPTMADAKAAYDLAWKFRKPGE